MSPDFLLLWKKNTFLKQSSAERLLHCTQTGTAWLGWFSLAGCQVPTKATPSLLLSWTGERKHDKRFMGWDKDRERSPTNYCHGQNRLNSGK